MLAHLLERIRRRTIVQSVLEQGAVALVAALGGLIALLVTGTQILDWYWPLLLMAGAFGVGLWRMRGRVPTTYEAARQADSRLGLADLLSTAFYFSQKGRQERASAELVLAQRRCAEQTAATADAASAAPMRMPRRAWVSMTLLGLAGALLLVRYGVRGNLDLRQPLVHIPFESFAAGADLFAKNQRLPKQKLPEGMQGLTLPDDERGERAGDRRPTPDEMSESETIETDQAAGRDAQARQSSESEKAGRESGEAGEKGEGGAASDDRSQQESGSKTPGQQNAKSPSQSNQQSSPQSSENSSLMDKMRDAMANMLARLKMTPRPGDSRQSMSAQQGAAQSASAQKQMGQKGAPAPGKPQAEGQSESDQEGEQQGEGASKNMNAQGKMSDSGADKQQAQEGKTGAGKQEGDKDIKQAEQQAAMGKISEILGKRAQNLTGEIMVEVSSGKQHLKTQYVQKTATHSDTGGEISRDEVPAAYQQFVQQYFEEIHKPASAKAKPAAEGKK